MPAELCKSGPAEWNHVRQGDLSDSAEVVGPAPRLRRDTFSYAVRPLRARMNLDTFTPAPDGDAIRTGLDHAVEDKQHAFLELHGIFKRRQGEKPDDECATTRLLCGIP